MEKGKNKEQKQRRKIKKKRRRRKKEKAPQNSKSPTQEHRFIKPIKSVTEYTHIHIHL